MEYVDGDTENGAFTATGLDVQNVWSRIKNKIKTYEEKAISAKACTSNYMPLVFVGIHCEQEMEKQDL